MRARQYVSCASERFGDGGEHGDELGDHIRIHRFGAAVGLIVEERIITDDGLAATSGAVHYARFVAGYL